MPDLKTLVEDIRSLDWGCGCCSSGSTSEIKEGIASILNEAFQMGYKAALSERDIREDE